MANGLGSGVRQLSLSFDRVLRGQRRLRGHTLRDHDRWLSSFDILRPQPQPVRRKREKALSPLRRGPATRTTAGRAKERSPPSTSKQPEARDSESSIKSKSLSGDWPDMLRQKQPNPPISMQMTMNDEKTTRTSMLMADGICKLEN
ncbi:hypothetical protein E4U48_006790 [Claviceps purpurea]|nr:hypothetical protein E4U48_006790 [Claviceps purpurea]